MVDVVTVQVEPFDYERAGVTVAAGIEGHPLENVANSDQIAAVVEAPAWMLEAICKVARLLPDAEADIAGCRRRIIIQNLAAIGVPDIEASVDHLTVNGKRCHPHAGHGWLAGRRVFAPQGLRRGRRGG